MFEENNISRDFIWKFSNDKISHFATHCHYFVFRQKPCSPTYTFSYFFRELVFSVKFMIAFQCFANIETIIDFFLSYFRSMRNYVLEITQRSNHQKIVIIHLQEPVDPNLCLTFSFWFWLRYLHDTSTNLRESVDVFWPTTSTRWNITNI